MNISQGTLIAELGKSVKLDYILKVEGKVKDTSIESEAKSAGIYQDYRQYEPMSVTLGKGHVIPGFEKNVIGMKPGEEKTFSVPPLEAYGERHLDNIKRYPRELFEKQGIELEIGSTLIINTSEGRLFGFVQELSEEDVTLDMNHELAGKTLTFTVSLKEINSL